MTHAGLPVTLAAAAALAFAAAAHAQAPEVPSTAVVGSDAVVRDCSRWPASSYDEATGTCVCPPGMWWNLRGDACLPREHAAGEFCATVWPGASPFFVSGGGYRCVCAPPLLWDSQATACRMPVSVGEADCTAEWPGTFPVLSPSGTEFECRCPGGFRWDEGSRACVAGAPVVPYARGFSNEGAVAPPPVPGQAAPGVPSPTGPTYPGLGEPGFAPPSAGPDARPQGQGAAPGAMIPPVPRGDDSKCARLLAEIRGRAQAGQAPEAEALGMKAAVAGCDPAAIAEASRVP